MIIMSLFILWIFSIQILDKFYYEEKVKDLEARASLIKSAIDTSLINDSEYLNNLCHLLGEQTKTRITIVQSDGIIIGDSHELPEIMDNHSDRPEVIAAINHKIGTAKRYSYTLEKGNALSGNSL